jgi:hypothetical protein
MRRVDLNVNLNGIFENFTKKGDTLPCHLRL